MANLDGKDAIPLSPDHGRHEPVDVIEVGQREVDLTRKRLDAATAVANPIAQQRVPDAIRGSGRDPPLPAILSPAPFALDQTKAGRDVRIKKRHEKCRQIQRQILAVRVKCRDVARLCCEDPGSQRG